MSVTVDARGLKCPWPVLRAAKAMRDSAEIVVLADDPSAPDEIAMLATARGWEYSHAAPGCMRVSRPPR